MRPAADGLGDAPEQRPFDAALAGGPDDDVVEPLVVGVLDDRPDRVTGQRLRLGLAVALGGESVGALEDRLGVPFGLLFGSGTSSAA